MLYPTALLFVVSYYKRQIPELKDRTGDNSPYIHSSPLDQVWLNNPNYRPSCKVVYDEKHCKMVGHAMENCYFTRAPFP